MTRSLLLSLPWRASSQLACFPGGHNEEEEGSWHCRGISIQEAKVAVRLMSMQLLWRLVQGALANLKGRKPHPIALILLAANLGRGCSWLGTYCEPKAKQQYMMILLGWPKMKHPSCLPQSGGALKCLTSCSSQEQKHTPKPGTSAIFIAFTAPCLFPFKPPNT